MKPQDIVIALAIRLLPQESWTYPKLGACTGLAISQVHSSCVRLKYVRLLRQDPGEKWLVSSRNLREFLTHGVKYAFAGKVGAATRGVPTAQAAPFAVEALGHPDVPLVWPAINGPVRGARLDPLHRCQYHAIAQPGGDAIYRVLACVDMLRVGGEPKERAWATDQIAQILA